MASLLKKIDMIYNCSQVLGFGGRVLRLAPLCCALSQSPSSTFTISAVSVNQSTFEHGRRTRPVERPVRNGERSMKCCWGLDFPSPNPLAGITPYRDRKHVRVSPYLLIFKLLLQISPSKSHVRIFCSLESPCFLVGSLLYYLKTYWHESLRLSVCQPS